MTDLPTWLAVALAVAGLLFPVGGVVVGQLLQRRTTEVERKSIRFETHADEALETVSQVLVWLANLQPEWITGETPEQYLTDLDDELQEVSPSLMKSIALLVGHGRASTRLSELHAHLHKLMSACEKIHEAARHDEDTQVLMGQGVEAHENARDTAMDVLETIHIQLKGNGSQGTRKGLLR